MGVWEKAYSEFMRGRTLRNEWFGYRLRAWAGKNVQQIQVVEDRDGNVLTDLGEWEYAREIDF